MLGISKLQEKYTAGRIAEMRLTLNRLDRERQEAGKPLHDAVQRLDAMIRERDALAQGVNPAKRDLQNATDSLAHARQVLDEQAAITEGLTREVGEQADFFRQTAKQFNLAEWPDLPIEEVENQFAGLRDQLFEFLDVRARHDKEVASSQSMRESIAKTQAKADQARAAIDEHDRQRAEGIERLNESIKDLSEQIKPLQRAFDQAQAAHKEADDKLRAFRFQYDAGYRRLVEESDQRAQYQLDAQERRREELLAEQGGSTKVNARPSRAGAVVAS